MDGAIMLRGYKKPFHTDVDKNSGGLLVYVKSGIPAKRLTGFVMPIGFQAICIEIRLRSQKWLLISIYNPNKNLGCNFLNNLSSVLDFYSRKYERCVIIGDFNMETKEPLFEDFILGQNLYELVKQKTCFKSSEGSAIDLILTSNKLSFQYTNTIETGLSDHHKMIYTMFKSTYTRNTEKVINYRSYKNFILETYLEELSINLRNDISTYNYTNFEEVFLANLNKHAPIKSKKIRGNDKPYMSQKIRKEIMIRSRLKNKAIKTKLPENYRLYKIQRNKVLALIRSEKKLFFSNLCIKSDQKNFWEACKPILSSKSNGSREKIHLMENGSIISDDLKTSNIFNESIIKIKSFINVISSLKIKTWNDNFSGSLKGPNRECS